MVMKKGLYSPPDAFSLSPMLTLLPVKGNIGKVTDYQSSLYARFENVAEMKAQLSDGDMNSDARRSLEAEEAMLKVVLDWLAEDSEEEEV